MSDKKAVAFRFDAEIADLLVQAASDAHLSQVDVLQQAIREYAARQRSLQNAIHGVADEPVPLQNAIQPIEPIASSALQPDRPVWMRKADPPRRLVESPAPISRDAITSRHVPSFAEQMEAAKAAGGRPR